MAKVLIINGSPRPAGNTHTALEQVKQSIEKQGIATEYIQIGNQAIRGCMACGRCREISHCIIDDVVNQIAPKFEQADGIVVGSPVYYASPNGTLISLLDRLFFSTSFDKSQKVGAAVVVARRGGCTAALDVLNKYFSISNMPIATSQYWNLAHGNALGESAFDLEGMQTMRHLGQNMAFLIRSLALGREQLGHPTFDEDRQATNFIR